MNPCPKCGQMVMQMAKSCRFCGAELDEQTFFLNEAAMLAEVQAMRQETEQAQVAKEGLARRERTLKAGSIFTLLGSGGLMLLDQPVFAIVAGIGAIAGVGMAIAGIRAGKQRETSS